VPLAHALRTCPCLQLGFAASVQLAIGVRLHQAVERILRQRARHVPALDRFAHLQQAEPQLLGVLPEGLAIAASIA
jgi:hypothetical protein